MRFDVLCVGNIVADVVGKPISRLPRAGTLMHVKQMELHNGGCAANAAIDMGKLGIRVAVVGKVGVDGFGDYLIQSFKNAGVDGSGVKRDRSYHTSATMVVVGPDGERSFLHHSGANDGLSDADVPDALLRSSKVLLMNGYFLMKKLDGAPTVRLLKRAKRMGVTTVLDVCWDPQNRWWPLLKPCLPHVDYFMPSREEAERLSGRTKPSEMAAFFKKHGARHVVVKLGHKGSYFSDTDGTEGIVNSFKVKSVDTTGAGDAFVAGFLTGLIKGWPMRKCCQLGNAAGARCVSAMGASAGIRSYKNTYKLLN